MLAARQHERLNELVAFARANSRFYAEKYRGLPETITDASLLPPVTKVELMEHFDDVITDLQALGVARVAPTHCSGDRARGRFAEAFGDGFVLVGVGSVLTVGR